MMAIYTKTGDKGKTSLFDGARVRKDDLRVETYGTFDECNAQISVAEKYCQLSQNKKLLKQIEYKMFFLQGEIATQDTDKFYGKSQRIEAEDIQLLEHVIDDYTTKLPKVTSFILPGQSLAGAQLHVCRTLCRRAERRLIQLGDTITFRPEIEQYVNRLSDLMYILARAEDHEAQQEKIVDEVVKRYMKAIESN
ncbi:adenosylcobalamin-dependent diol dehydratase gamma subunit [Loigolactobacillus rennini DSM 20253]|uniref:Corrinoid adenosyltransferase n=2 Tax=Loigolactobacillus rennini TaxID=238013 RepID=A0A0R2D117_9LACO|nr:adenosylcobalamin-dependent diol dehydratase gamma subunit [Loigolactobacillus rennini DSM 20253]